MASLWPWFVVAGVGALHGLNPTTGWMFAAAWGIRSGNRRHALRALLPIAIGHGASVAVVAALVALGVSMNRETLVALVIGALAIVAVSHMLRASQADSARAGHAGGRMGKSFLSLWSFTTSTLHGSGLMLVPALVPLCSSTTPGRELTASGSLTIALAVVATHTAAMLVVTAVAATVACRGVEAGASRLRALRGAKSCSTTSTILRSTARS